MPLRISNSTVTLAWSTVHVVEFLNLPGGPTCATVAFCKCKETLVKVHGYYHLLTHTCAVQTTHICMHADPRHTLPRYYRNWQNKNDINEVTGAAVSKLKENIQ